MADCARYDQGKEVFRLDEVFGAWDAELTPDGNILLTEFSVSQARDVGRTWDDALDSLVHRYGSCRVFDGRGQRALDAADVAELLASPKLLNLLFVPSIDRRRRQEEAR